MVVPVHLLQGKQAEEIAHTYLATRGLSLVEKNFSCKLGEIDLIMKDLDCLVFVEVRLRSSDRFGTPAETITRKKQRRLINTGNYYLQKCNLTQQACRFDVVAIRNVSAKHSIEWIKNAFWV